MCRGGRGGWGGGGGGGGRDQLGKVTLVHRKTSTGALCQKPDEPLWTPKTRGELIKKVAASSLKALMPKAMLPSFDDTKNRIPKESLVRELALVYAT